MNKMMKECMKPHSIAHSVEGAGVILIVSALIPAIAANALVVGVVLLIAGIAYDMMVNKG
ncbi:hypothetical protein HY024_01590 [Candidatus Curtissbacteria bacterium]|nr:hypothetical protein [Candidatus Curtissbacteria bacterium]